MIINRKIIDRSGSVLVKGKRPAEITSRVAFTHWREEDKKKEKGQRIESDSYLHSLFHWLDRMREKRDQRERGKGDTNEVWGKMCTLGNGSMNGEEKREEEREKGRIEEEVN